MTRIMSLVSHLHRFPRWGLLLASLALGGCDRKTSIDPFAPELRLDAGSAGEAPEAGGATDDLLVADDEGLEHQEVDPRLGGRCLSDSQCDDGIDCTSDACDLELSRCRFEARDNDCQDEVYCNGQELCVLGVGCRPGEPVTCDDGSPCTIDRCVEETRDCERLERDVDGDGDIDAHCAVSGGDCNDLDPSISSLGAEVCANLRDDDCDGQTDEVGCVAPRYDDCSVALTLSAGGTERLSFDATRVDTSASCSATGSRDVAIVLDVAEPADVVLTLRGAAPDFAVALRNDCEDVADELGCVVGVAASEEEAVARVLLRAAEPGTYSAIVFKSSPGELELSVDFRAPTPAADNERCSGASPLQAGEPIEVDLLGASSDHPSRCASPIGAGDLVYRFSLDAASDVRVAALPAEPGMAPVLSLRGAACADPSDAPSADDAGVGVPDADEIACTAKDSAELFARSLAAGTYFVVVSAAVAGELELLLLVEPASEPPPGESCEQPRALVPGQVVNVPLDTYADDVPSACLASGRDAVLSLHLEGPSDVLLRQRLTRGDTGAIALLDAGCRSDEPLVCTSGDEPPLRALSHALPEGDYTVVAESLRANPATVFAAVRPSRPAQVVAAADRCEDAELISENGGRFTGNTSGASADFTASCDVANVTPGGAPDQLLRLELAERSRVIIDGSDSRFAVLINLRRGPDCPGTELFGGCATPDRNGSYIENVLDAGTYFVQVDGHAGRSGQWALEVFVLAEP